MKILLRSGCSSLCSNPSLLVQAQQRGAVGMGMHHFLGCIWTLLRIHLDTSAR